MKSVAQQIREMGDRLSALYNEGPADDMMNKAAGAADAVSQAQKQLSKTSGNMSRSLTDIEDNYLNIREKALKYVTQDRNMDLYQAYVMAAQDEGYDPAMVFDWMGSEFKDPEIADAVPAEAENGGWLDRYEKEDDSRTPKIADATMRRILAKKEELVDQGMEPEDAQDAAAEFFKVDPAEFDKFFSSRNESSELDRIKKLSGI
jgi:hypothetical protein